MGIVWALFTVGIVLAVYLFISESRRIWSQYKRDMAVLEARHAAESAAFEEWKAEVLTYLDK